jgi:xanthine dehydrogenase large subunit
MRIPENAPNVAGRTRYIDDLPEPRDCLHAAVRLSESARGRIIRVDPAPALALDPSVRVFLAADVPGENQLGMMVADEPLLPEGEWDCLGQPLALVLAADRDLARRAALLVRVEGEELPPVLDAREAAARGDLILPPRTQSSGDVAAAWARCAVAVSGRARTGGQEHVYLETQAAFALPLEGNRVRIVSGTQGPTVVQRAVARTLGLPMSSVEVEAPRLGGGFGGKEDQAMTWAALAALGAWKTGRPVKLVLDRQTDMRATGKRHPYDIDWRIGMDGEGRLLAYEADFYQNSGSTCDLSPGILSRSLFHAVGAYRVPNVRVTGRMCRTNLPSFTAFRGFGAPQAFFAVEAAMDALAAKAGMDPVELRRRNLVAEGDITHFGQRLEGARARESFDRLLERANWEEYRARMRAWNAAHPLEKRGAAVIPDCFGVSFTKLPMNQGGALVHVYQDGSVLVSTGAVEMGQQVNRKIALVAARELGVPAERVRVERTSTLTVANTVPTAASTGSDINGMAAQRACAAIRERLAAQAALMLGASPSELELREGRVLRLAGAAGSADATVPAADTGLSWEALVAAAHEARVDLSAHGHYATPNLVYDMTTEKGSPFAYHVYGAALVEVKLDCLRGRYAVEKVLVVHDSGRSIDPAVDRGQVEGALAQGLGWALLEDLRFDGKGRLLSDSLATYKLPDMDFMPRELEVEFLPVSDNPKAVLGSKAVGEPPLIYGIAGWFALQDALRAARPGVDVDYALPLTAERCLGLLAIGGEA